MSPRSATSLRADLRAVSRGWRWGRTPLAPADAQRWVPAPTHREFPTRWARSPAARQVRAGLQRYGLRPLVWSQTSPRVVGLDVLDGLAGPVVFVANHTSHLDAALVLSSLPPAWRRETAVAAAADYFFDSWWRAVGSALAFSTFPIERRAGTVASTASELLDEGWSLVVFPEGTRSRDGWMGQFRRGAAYLAQRQRVPVVPIGLRGAFDAMPRGRSWPRPGRPPVHVRYGAPVVPEPGEDPRALSARVYAALSRVLDEDATDWYAALRRASQGTTPPPTGPSAARWRRVWAATEPVGDASPAAAARRRPVWQRPGPHPSPNLPKPGESRRNNTRAE